MTSGSLWKQIPLFSIPLMLSNVLQVFFNMADVAVVGRFAGSSALGSVGSTSILIMLFTGFLIGMGSGVNALLARFYGANDRENVSQTSHTALILCLGAGIAVMGAGLLLSGSILCLLDTKEELMEGALLYVRIYLLGAPAVAIYNYGNGVLSAIGDTKRPLVYLSVAGVLNVILNLFFVIVCDMSVAGVALASVISQYLSAFLILGFLFRCGTDYGVRLSSLRIHPTKAKLLLALGVPSGIQNAIFMVANLFIQTGVNSFDTLTVEGNAAAANYDALVYDIMAAFYIACSSFMAQCYGAGKRERVLKSYFISLIYAFGFGLACGALLLIFERPALSLFTTDAAVVDAGLYRLRIMAVSYAFSAFMDCTIAASRGLGKTVVPTVIVIMGSCVFRIVWIYTVFAHFATIPSLYLLYIFSWTLTGIAEILYFRHCYKQRMKEMNAMPFGA